VLNTKSQEGIGCLLIDPTIKHTIVACRLEIDCMNNIDKYEALVLGLQKFAKTNVKCLKFFGDSKIIVRYVKNFVHCNFPHLKGYQE
jgi:ribonuclease HI